MAGMAIAELIPGISSVSMPFSLRYNTSSAPLPNTYGSPPLSRTTSFPSSAFAKRSSLISCCGALCFPFLLPTYIFSQLSNAYSRILSSIRSSYTSTCALFMALSALTVMRSYEPHPAPAIITLPFFTSSLLLSVTERIISSSSSSSSFLSSTIHLLAAALNIAALSDEESTFSLIFSLIEHR